MAGQFLNIRFVAADKGDDELLNVGTRPLTLRGVGRPRSMTESEASFNNDEGAARHYLNRIFEQDSRPGVRGLVAPERAAVVPDLRFLDAKPQPLTGTRLVRFDQTNSSIPIFGSRVVVELDEHRELVSMDAEVASVKGVSPVASLSPAQALESIAKLTGVSDEALKDVQPPQLNFYHDEKDDSWHLAYLFKKVPAAPTEFLDSISKGLGHGLGPSPRANSPQLNYLVDAHEGQVLFYYSATPLLDVPAKLKGIDELNIACDFWGRAAAGSAGNYEMVDPIRSIKTFDLCLGDLETAPLPSQPVHTASYNFAATNTAAVSAHVNATRVYVFYKSVLMRDGIDDKGMDLVSVVNCTYPRQEAPPQWHNAVWWNNRMSYGQVQVAGGKLHSFARYLDVIAHELTHGVTEFTSNLVYQGQSGALNESFSDIFGVIINNWYTIGADSDPRKWNWEIGSGLGGGVLPLRDMSNPARTKDPDHMNNFWNTRDDSGGVHTNSNIHNKAAYNVLTALDENSQVLFPPREVAVLFYLCLARLNSLATFSKTLQTLVDVATTYYPDPVERDKKVKAIKEAYGKVGIT